MSENALGADNQQETQIKLMWGSSETTRETPTRNEIKAYLQEALHDATFSSNKRFRFSQKGREWPEILQEMLQILGYRSWIYREGKTRNVYVLETLADFLDFKFNPLKLHMENERCSYVRGFFDAEGGIPHSATDKFYIQLVQNDREKLRKIKCILSSLGMDVGKVHNPSRRVHPEYWRMFIRTDSHKKFIERIGSMHPRKRAFLRERMMI